MTSIPLLRHGAERHPWRVPGVWDPGGRDYDATLPPLLDGQRVAVPPGLLDDCRDAALHLALLDRGAARATAAAAPMLIQAEALASSLVEGYMAGPEQVARAEAGQPTTASARAVTRAAGALAAHLKATTRAVSLGAIASAHSRPRRLANGRETVQPYRGVQTWRGGSDLWPDGALFVPPHPSHVPALMDDVVAFAAREDVDPVAQAAIVHAQVACIQPFADGNERVALALLNGVWRWRGVTTALAAPVGASLLADRRRHDAAIKAFRDGDAGPIVALVARHANTSAHTTGSHALQLAQLPTQWREAARPRAGSAAAGLIDHLAARPIVDAAEVRRLTGASQASAYTAIARLADAGILTRISPTRRETVWAALDVFEASAALVADLAGATGLSSPRLPPWRSAAA